MSGTLTASSSLADLKVFSDESLEILRLRGNDTKIVSGVRIISNTSYSSEESVEQETDVAIPDQLESLETFQFLEFVPQQAQILWDRLLARRQSQPERAYLLGTAVRHIESFEDIMYADEDWIGTMDAMGLNKELQTRFMDPNFDDMRFTATLKESVLDMIKMRYEFLHHLDGTLKSVLPVTVSRKLSKPNLDDSFANTLVSPGKGSKAKHLVPTPPRPEVATATSEYPTDIDGHLLLYKGASRERLQNCLLPDGHLLLQRLLSNPPTDFNAFSTGLYLTKQREVAHKYAEWSRTLAKTPVAVMTIAVPVGILQGFHEIVGDDLGRFVWANRRQHRPDEHFNFLYGSAGLIGPIIADPTDRIKKMDDMSQMKVLKVPGKDGGSVECRSQYYTHQTQIISLLNNHCEGQVWLTDLTRSGETEEERGDKGGSKGKGGGKGKGKGKGGENERVEICG